MEPHGDPEARIRDLERPLAERARASELASVPYGADGGDAPAYSRRSRSRWFVLVVGAVGLLIFGTAAVGFLNLALRSEPVADAPEVFGGGGGRFDTGAAPGEPAQPGEPISISGVNRHETIRCTGCLVNVSGVSNTVVIVGHSARVSVSGVENAVTVDSVDAITASGIENRVTYHFGSPEIVRSGSRNVVEQG